VRRRAANARGAPASASSMNRSNDARGQHRKRAMARACARARRAAGACVRKQCARGTSANSAVDGLNASRQQRRLKPAGLG
jgi:hypothetical protein